MKPELLTEEMKENVRSELSEEDLNRVFSFSIYDKNKLTFNPSCPHCLRTYTMITDQDWNLKYLYKEVNGKLVRINGINFLNNKHRS